jgi:hypothetical protein
MSICIKNVYSETEFFNAAKRSKGFSLTRELLSLFNLSSQELE